MKKLLIPLLLISLTAVASEPLWKKIYFRADGGAGVIQKTNVSEFKNSPVYSGGIGFNFNEMFRADLNFQHRKIKADITKSKANSLLKNADSNVVFLNGYFNLTDFEEMTPYLTAGIGYGSNKTKDSFKDNGNIRTFGSGKKTSQLVWNVGAGTTYNIYKNLNLDFAYRFVNLGNLEFKDTGQKIISTGASVPVNFTSNSKNAKSHELTLGVILKL